MDTIAKLKSVSLLDYIEKVTGQRFKKEGSNAYRLNPCPICKTGDHFTLNSDKNYWNGFGNCGGGSIIDFYMKYFGVGKGNAIDALCDEYNIENVKISQRQNGLFDLTTIINEQFLLGNNYSYFMNRLYQDGLDENLNKLIDSNHFLTVNPKKLFASTPNLLPQLPNIDAYEYIIPIWKNGKVTNCILRRNDKKSTDNCKMLNLKSLPVEFWGLDYICQNTPRIFVTEGIFDCLSIECLGHNSMCLNSVNMAQKFIDLINSKKSDLKDTTFVLALDNDEKGNEASNKIAEGLDGMGIQTIKLTIKPQYKDINAYYLEDLDGLKEAISLCCTNKDNTTMFLENGFYSSVEKYLKYQNKLTGFKLLDENLSGILPALYLIGAVSSIGKTTFMLQLADNIAKNGNDVLYFSLEQSKFELVAKSLSRIAWTTYDEKYSAKNIMYNTDPELTTQCIESYKLFSDRLFIYEGNFGTTVSDIEKIITNHIYLTRNSPLVIIDYLQVIKGDGISDKMVIDNMVTTLKRISRNLFIPIFVVSSLNRANYLSPISYESFKESGSIEYTADTLLGLQYLKVHDIQDIPNTKMSHKKFEMRNAINGDPTDNYRRDIELVALKNRHGGQQFSINLKFYPGLNYFEEGKVYLEL